VVCVEQFDRRGIRIGKLDGPNWLAAYCWKVASVTGWGYDEIMYSLPFAVGLQILHADDTGKGRQRPWRNSGSKSKIDALAKIEDAFR